ncbi:MAG: hypothetical protein J6B89_00435 [Bacilli bacterium]|nr:hypothetical protein [Bacilli bacterium]
MKYLKITMTIFVLTTVFAIYNANAATVGLANIKIPTFSTIYMSTEHQKDTENQQYIKKIDCTDNLSGDGRVILARTYSPYAGVGYSSWIEAPKGSNATWGNENKTVAGYKIQLKSNKSLPTAATFYGTWTLN